MFSEKTITAYALTMLLAASVCAATGVNDTGMKAPYSKYEFDHGYTIIRGESYGFRPTARNNMEFKWSYTTKGNVGAIDVVDLNGDEKPEILVGLDTAHLMILGASGSYMAQYYVGNSSILGKIYSIHTSDINNDGKKEIVLGLGGARTIFTYSKTGFEAGDSGTTIQPQTKVLYQVIRNYGGVYVLDFLGNLLWNYTTPDSINVVKTARRATLSTETIYAGLGETTRFIYNEYGDYVVRKRNCENVEMENETTYYDEEHCTCDGCRWYDDPMDPEGGECLRTYEYERCVWEETNIKGWNLTEYPRFNGSVLFLDPRGNITASKDIITLGKDSKVVEDADNNVVDLEVGDINHDLIDEVAIASDNGNLYMMNQTNLSRLYWMWTYNASVEVKSIALGDLDNDNMQEIVVGTNDGTLVLLDNTGNLKWKQKLSDIITDIKIRDIEADGYVDIIATTRDKRVYVLDASGTLRWEQNVGRDAYGVYVDDIDRNNLDDVIVFSMSNVTCYELTEFYVKRRRGITFYEAAYDNMQTGDYTKAMIFAQKAKLLFEDIKDQDNLGKCKILIDKINDDLVLHKKNEADRYYQDALTFYSVNKLDDAVVYAERAKVLYTEINDKEGVGIIDTFLTQVKTEKVFKRKTEGDGYYAKALGFKALGNYSAAIEAIQQATAIYEEVKYFNGTLQCRLLIIRIGDDHYNKAERYFRTKDFKQARDYAVKAREFYALASDNASISNVDALMEKINAGETPVETGFSLDYRLIAVAAVLVIIVLFVAKRKKPEYVESEGFKPDITKTFEVGDLEPLDEKDKPEG